MRDIGELAARKVYFAGRWLGNASDDIEQRAFASTRDPAKNYGLAMCYLEIDVLEHQWAVFESEAHMFDL